MSLYNALADSHNQPNRGWSYSSSCNRSSSVFSKSTSVSEQPSPSVVQPQSLQSLLNTPTSSDCYVPLQETQASKKEEDSLLLDDPGLVIGQEEVILTESTPVASTGYDTSSQSQTIFSRDLDPTYMKQTNHTQFVQNAPHITSSQQSLVQQDLVNHSHTVMPFPMDNYGSVCHPQPHRMQMQHPYGQQVNLIQQSHGALQKDHAQQQAVHGVQQHAHGLQVQQQLLGSLQAASQQHGQSHGLQYLGGQQLNANRTHHLSLTQQGDVGQSPQMISQQRSIGQNMFYNQGQGQVRLADGLGESPSSSQNTALTYNVCFVNGNQNSSSSQSVMINRLQQTLHPQFMNCQSNPQAFQSHALPNQHVSRLTHNNLLGSQNQIAQSQQSVTGHIPLQNNSLTFQMHQGKSTPHLPLHQSYDSSALFVGQRLGLDQHQQQACSQKQQQQQQACSQQQQACSQQQQACSQQHEVSSQQQQACSQQLQQQQENVNDQKLLLLVHPNSASSGHFLPQSSQQPTKVTVSQQTVSQMSLISTPQNMGSSAQNSPQISLGTSQSFPKSTSSEFPSRIVMLQTQTPQYITPKTPGVFQGVTQVGQLPQVLNCTANVMQSPHPVLQMQSNSQQVLHLQSTPNQILSLPTSGNSSTPRTFQGHNVEENQFGASTLVPSSNRGRGQSRAKAGRGRGGGRGSRGRGKTDSSTGLHMSPNHFRPDPVYQPVVESSGAEQLVSNAEDPMCSQEQSMQELAVLTPKAEGENSSPLDSTQASCIDYSPPYSLSSTVPRLSATNEVWPTPMPSVNKKQEPTLSPPQLIVESISSCSQQSSDCPAYSPPSYLEDMKTSPPAAPAVLPAPLPEVVSPITPAQPAQPTVPSSPEQRPEVPNLKHKLAEDEEKTAVCKYCGYCSSNLEICEGCNRKLPHDVKVVVKKMKRDSAERGDERERTCGGGKVNNLSPISNPSLNKKNVYGSKLAQNHGTAFSNNLTDLSSNNLIGKNAGRSITRRRGSGTPRAFRGKKLKEPVLVTISSDEDEPVSDASPRLSSAIATNNIGPDEDDGFFSSPVTKPNSFGTSRRNKMLDASGQCVQQASQLQSSVEGIYFEVRGVRIGLMRTSGQEVRFKAENIFFRVVSDRTQQEHEFTLCVMELMWIKFSFNQSQPVVFLKVTPDCAARLRTQLKMTADSPEDFDPSSSDDMKSMIVIIVDNMLNDKGLREIFKLYNQLNSLKDLLQEINYDTANDLLVKSTPPPVINHNHRDSAVKGYQRYTSVAKSLPALSMTDRGDHIGCVEVQNEVNGPLSMAGDSSSDTTETSNNHENGGSRTPSPGRVVVRRKNETLLAYPPPPEKGAITITTNDLECLDPGQFLNDVILDFYLKYLFLEKLSPKDRSRTHIFSSFFFKRLTQRTGRSTDEKEKNMSVAQKRHSRVKRWTRNVDIFSKDFLLIPINEKSHWYLAVICFPGLTATEHVSYQAMPSPYGTVGQSGDTPQTPTQTQQSADDEQSQDSLPDTATSTEAKNDPILGQVVDEETVRQGGPYSVGLKQPCVLIMDSFMSSIPSKNNIIRTLKEYLQVEWDQKKCGERNFIKEVRGGSPKVPQQTNYTDCGLYVLQYAESFFENPIGNFSIPMKLENWFPLVKVERKREEIRDLIMQLKTESCR